MGYLTLVLPFGLSLEWLFKGLERMWLVAVVRVVRAGVFLVVTLLVVSVGRSPGLYALGEGLSWCVSSALLYLCARTYFSGEPAAEEAPPISRLIVTSLPIGLAWLLTTAYQLGAVVLLTFLSGTEQAGLYGAAQRPVIFLHGFGVLLGESLVATFVRASDVNARGDLTLRISVVTLAVILPVSISMSFGAAGVAAFVFGDRFLPAAPVLGLLLWQSLFILLNIPFYVTLVACGLERAYLRAIAIGAIATVALDVLMSRLSSRHRVRGGYHVARGSSLPARAGGDSRLRICLGRVVGWRGDAETTAASCPIRTDAGGAEYGR